MTAGAAIVLILLGLGLLFLAIRVIRANRTPRELRGDWWSEFEHEFRTYAALQARRQAGRDRLRRPRPEQQPRRESSDR